MRPDDNLFGCIKNGVVTLGGYVSRITVETANLCIIDGYKGTETKLSFPRSNCPVSRILSLNDAGYISFAAARWLHETGIAFTHLNYDGSPILTSVFQRKNPSSIRRAQVMLYSTDLGREIARVLIQTKIEGQIANLKHFDRLTDPLQSQLLRYASKLLPAESPSQSDILGAEGMIASLYWRPLVNFPIKFGRRQSVPKHWKSFGSRRSTITGDPRGAVTPGNAMLNYLYGVLCSEVTIALHAMGLDPSTGLLHEDKDNRASLAYDLMEPARPILDHWFFHWLQHTTFSKRDFFETIEGFIRVTHPLNSHLAMTAALWRGLADQLVRWFLARLTGDMKAQLQLRPVFDGENEAKRRAVRWTLGNTIERPIPTTCQECGKALPHRRRKFCSAECTRSYHGGAPVEAGLAAIRPARAAGKFGWMRRKPLVVPDGGEPAGEALRKVLSVAEWRRLPGWSEERDTTMIIWFKSELAPRLVGIRPVDISRAIGFGSTFSVGIRKGIRVPHPRWYQVLAELAKVEYPFAQPVQSKVGHAQ
jgi:CRISPR-associated protein Cas1